MKDIVELDEDDIIRVLSMEIAREKGWATTGYTGVVTLSTTVSARVEKVAVGYVTNGKRKTVRDPR